MPIHELQEGVPRFKRLGIIRLGKPKHHNRPGEPSDHFELRDAPELVAIYGPAPTKLNVFLPFDDLDLNLDAWHRLYGAGALKCRGDGRIINYCISDAGEVLVRDGIAQVAFDENGEHFEPGDVVPCPGFQRGYPKCKDCQPRAILRVMIREIPRLGYWQIATSSKHSILNLTGELRWTKEFFGRLAGIPMILELRAEPISVPMQGKRVRMKKYILHIEPDPAWVKARVQAIQREVLPELPKAEVAATEALLPGPSTTVSTAEPAGGTGNEPPPPPSPPWEEQPELF